MSSRYEKEKRLRPKNNPYKRDHFNQTDYLKITKENKYSNNSQDLVEEEYYDDYYDEEDER